MNIEKVIDYQVMVTGFQVMVIDYQVMVIDFLVIDYQNIDILEVQLMKNVNIIEVI